MKWGRKNRPDDEKKTKQPSKKTPSPFSLFPFSLISRLKREKQGGGALNPNRLPLASSDHLTFPSGDAPRRRSTGDDDPRRRSPFDRNRADIARSARHHSFCELELDLDLRPISSFPRHDASPPPTPMKRTEARRRGQRMRPKVRVCSPKATRRRAEEEGKGERRNLEGFAVVKSSSDPQRDFRESMEEMIREKGMRRPEEMERLLACYISLNADEHHDFIVKAFRQVWFDLDVRKLAGECHCCLCCDCF